MPGCPKKNFKLDFVGIGAPRCASTWISRCLKEHPQVCMSEPKETRFFQKPRYLKGIDYLQSFFKHCSTTKQIKGEFTPAYIFREEVISRIKLHNSEVKLIACLRNPIERAYSHYWLEHWGGGRMFFYSFREAIDKEIDGLIEAGLYHKYLRKYLEEFPRENVLILIYEDIFKDPLRFIQEIYRFLEVNEEFTPSSLKRKINPVRKQEIKSDKLTALVSFFRNALLRKNADPISKFLHYTLSWTGLGPFLWKKIRELNSIDKGDHSVRKRPKMKEEVRDYLWGIYKEDIEKLEELIQRDLSNWKISK